MRTSVSCDALSQRPLRPTLFPYTTLFRSRRKRRFNRELWAPAAVRFARHARRLKRMGVASVSVQQLYRLTGEPQDRKSTRLNSSHVAISYAVFCLKKKSYAIQSVVFFSDL